MRKFKTTTKIRLGLDRVREALAHLGRPEESFASVLIAGTNGKGSVSALVESVLRASGYETGLFTSPHLVDVRERVRVAGRFISDGDWRRLFKKVSALSHRRRLSLTEFEIHTLIAFLYFREMSVDIAVVEVGLGGRLDATNALPAPEAAVIASIGHDHAAFLGNTLSKIYFEKRGIARFGVPLFQSVPPSLLAEGESACRRNGTPLFTLGREIKARAVSVDWEKREQSFDVRLPWGKYEGLTIKLLGVHQIGNGALAAAVLDSLRRKGWNISDGNLRRGLRAASWPGRFHTLRESRGRPDVILDGAHNREAAEALARAYKSSPWGRRKTTLIFGCLKDKDAAAMARALNPIVGKVIAVPLSTARSLSSSIVKKIWEKKCPVETAADVPDAFKTAFREDAPVLAAGSLYLVGEAVKFLKLKIQDSI